MPSNESTPISRFFFPPLHTRQDESRGTKKKPFSELKSHLTTCYRFAGYDDVHPAKGTKEPNASMTRFTTGQIYYL